MTEATPASRVAEAAGVSDDDAANPWLKVAIVGVLLFGGAVALLLSTDAGDAFTYSKPLSEVAAAPGDFTDRPVRLEGDLRQGSILFREDPCEWRFVLDRDGAEMEVRFPECVVPDTFRDEFGVTVTAQGVTQEDGGEYYFLASEIVPRCPSKYEMQERLEAGEAMPHPDPTGVEHAPAVDPLALPEHTPAADPLALPE